MAEGTQQVVADLPCVSCGYNLRMAMAEGLCPECGARVWKSIDESVLNWGAEYLRKLASRAIWVAVTALAIPAAWAVGQFAAYFLPRPPPILTPHDATIAMHYSKIVSLCSMLPIAVAAIAHAIAVWRSAAAPAGRSLSRHQVLMRVGVLMFLAAAVEPTIMAIVDLLSDERSNLLYYIQDVQLALPVLFLGLALYPQQAAEHLADIYRRAGQAHHAPSVCRRLWLFCGGVLLQDSALVLSLMLVTRRGSAARWDVIFLSLALAGLAFMLLGLVGAVVSLFKFSGHMRALAALAVPTLVAIVPMPAGYEAASE